VRAKRANVQLLRRYFGRLGSGLFKAGGVSTHERHIHRVRSEWKQDHRQHDRVESEHLPPLASGHVLWDRHGSSGNVTCARNVSWLGRDSKAAHAMSMLADDDAVTWPFLPKSPTETTTVADCKG